MPAPVCGRPSAARNASVGPLTARPPTSGLTAITGASAAAIASRIPGTARIGPIEITGFEGPMTIVRRGGDRREDLGRRGRGRDPVELDALDRRLAVVEDQELLQPAAPRGGQDAGADRLFAHGQHRRRDAERACDLCLRRGERAALGRGSGCGRCRWRGRDRRARTSPGAPSCDEALVHGEGVVADAPAAFLVDRVGEPVGDEVGVGADEEAMDLDVVAGVGDRRESSPPIGVLEAGGELRAPGAAGKADDAHRRASFTPSGRRRAGR